MPKDDENSIWFEVLQRLTKIETNEAIVYGAVSGLASTGLHQAFTQLLNIGKGNND